MALDYLSYPVILVEEVSQVREKPRPENIKDHEDSSFDVFDNACYIRHHYVPLFALEKENIGSDDKGRVRRVPGPIIRNKAMIVCTRCKTQNRDAAHFCRECGQFLDAVCPNCAHELPVKARFCDNCGLQLANQASLTGRIAGEISEPSGRLNPLPGHFQADQAAGDLGGQPIAGSLPSITEEQPSPAAESAISNSMSRLLPRELAAKLEAARAGGDMAGERRVVTMLFCDIKGSTAAAEQLDPEVWTDIINGAFEQMIRPIYQYEGTVARLMGDAILAFFGAPIAHEDDPVRAVLAGLDIVAGFAAYEEQVYVDFGLRIMPRVGINTGMVVAGVVGSDLRMEYTAMGDAINLAARMEQTAEAGTVQIAEDTYKLVAPLFEVEELGGIVVKGKAEPVEAYRVLRRKAEPGRLRGIAGVETRLIGREGEMAQLTSAADRLLAGVGSLACVTGEAGMGKSRLIRELKGYWEASHGRNGREEKQDVITWYESASFSYETVHPYALFQRLLRRMAGIVDGEAADSVRRKVDEQIALVPKEGQERMTAVFGGLLGLSTELEGEAFKGELFDSMPVFFRSHFATTPSILVLDDIHWSDSASVDLLLHLLPLVRELPLQLICVLRADRESPGWQVKGATEGEHKPQGVVIQLHPLSPSDSNALVDDLLAISDMPDLLRRQILEKSGGNPFFVEEVVRTLIDRGFVQQDDGGDRWTAPGEGAFDIPDNIQSLLTARIDHLAEEVRRTLQLAAVIGRSFYRRVLEHVAQTDLEFSGGDQVTGAHLSILQQQQMILEAARIPELIYMFRHALTQEAAYKAILRRQRQAIHLRVGNALQEMFGTDLDENAAVLAHHYWEAGDDLRAFRYLVMAGIQAFRLYALQEAIIHYDRAMIIARRTPGVDREQRLELCTQRGRTLELSSQHEEALAHYEEMQALAEDGDDGLLALESMTGQATLYNIPSAVTDPAKGEEIARGAQQLAQDIGNWEAAAKILWTLMLGSTWMTDDPQKAIEYGEASLRLTREHDLRRQLAYTLSDLAVNYMSAGRSSEARAGLLEANALFERFDDRPMLAQTHRLLGFLYYTQGQFEKAQKKMEIALAIDRPIENRWGILAIVQSQSVINFEQGDLGLAIERGEWALAEAISLALGPMSLHAAAYAAQVYSMAGDWGAALGTLDRLPDELVVEIFYPAWSWSIRTLVLLDQGDVEAAREANEKSQIDFDPTRPLTGGVVFASITIRLANIGVSLAAGELAKALEDVDELLAYLEQVQMPVYRPEALYLKGKILQEQERPAETRQIWKMAKTESEAMGERKMRWQILAGLAEVAEDGEETAELRRAACEIVTYIANNAGRAEHRDSFLNRPDVQFLVPAK